MATRSAIEVVRAMCEDVYGKGRTELISDLVHDDFREHVPLTGTRDPRGVEEAVQMFHRAFPDMTLEVIACVQGGDIVTARWRSTGTHKGDFMGVAPTNKRVNVEGITMVRVEDGKAREAWSQWDTLGMLRTLGAAPDLKARPDGGARAGAQRAQRR